MKEEIKKIANVWWSRDDAEAALDEREIPITKENIETLWDAIEYYEDRISEAMCSAGWDVVYDILDDLALAGDLELIEEEED